MHYAVTQVTYIQFKVIFNSIMYHHKGTNQYRSLSWNLLHSGCLQSSVGRHKCKVAHMYLHSDVVAHTILRNTYIMICKCVYLVQSSNWLYMYVC